MKNATGISCRKKYLNTEKFDRQVIYMSRIRGVIIDSSSIK